MLHKYFAQTYQVIQFVNPGLHVKVDSDYAIFVHFVLVITWHMVLQKGKCGFFVLVNKWIFEVNPLYGQSDFTVNLGPTIQITHLNHNVI